MSIKQFYIMDNIGKCKYTVNTHNGVDKHKDGSDFFGVRIFKNKKKRNLYLKELKIEGYIERC